MPDASAELVLLLKVKDELSAVVKNIEGNYKDAMAGMEKHTDGFSSKAGSAFAYLKENYINVSMAIRDASTVIKKAWDMAEVYAAFDEQKTSLNALAAQYGKSANDIIQSVKGASKGLIDMGTIAQVAGESLMKGLGPDQVAQIAGAAEVLSNVTGEKVVVSFDRLAQAIAKGNERALENSVGIIDLTERYGKQVEKMSDSEKAHARLQIVMEKVRATEKALGDSVSSTSDNMERMTIKMQDAQMMAGQYVIRAFFGVKSIFDSVAGSALILTGTIVKLGATLAEVSTLGLAKTAEQFKLANDLRGAGEALLRQANDEQKFLIFGEEAKKGSAFRPGIVSSSVIGGRVTEMTFPKQFMSVGSGVGVSASAGGALDLSYWSEIKKQQEDVDKQRTEAARKEADLRLQLQKEVTGADLKASMDATQAVRDAQVAADKERWKLNLDDALKAEKERKEAEEKSQRELAATQAELDRQRASFLKGMQMQALQFVLDIVNTMAAGQKVTGGQVLGGIGGMMGAGIGWAVGGPAGAMAGSMIGGTAGGILGGWMTPQTKSEGGIWRKEFMASLREGGVDRGFLADTRAMDSYSKSWDTFTDAIRRNKEIYTDWAEVIGDAAKYGDQGGKILAQMFQDMNVSLADQADLMGMVIARTKNMSESEGDLLAVQLAMNSAWSMGTEQLEQLHKVGNQAYYEASRQKELRAASEKYMQTWLASPEGSAAHVQAEAQLVNISRENWQIQQAAKARNEEVMRQSGLSDDQIRELKDPSVQTAENTAVMTDLLFKIAGINEDQYYLDKRNAATAAGKGFFSINVTVLPDKLKTVVLPAGSGLAGLMPA